jgi:hypothetical protein
VRRGWVLLAALVLLTGGAAAARAQEKPQLVPTRDVDVTYTMLPGGAGPGGAQPNDQTPLHQRMRWLAGQQLLRVDPPTPGLYMLVNYRTKHVAMVYTPDKQVMETDTASVGFPGASVAAGSFVRGSEDQVAGLACTNWATKDVAGEPAEVCITADGVMLRAVATGRTLVQATSVTYGPQDPTLFQVPAGYTQVKPRQ